jgi:predicted DNA-binding transcriptional regulator AlpA
VSKRPRTKPKSKLKKSVPATFHIDKRAGTLLAASDADKDDDDELLTTQQLAAWLGVSVQFLEIGRSNGYGPSFVMLSARRIGYQRSAVRAWLKERTFACTSQYAERPAPKRREVAR